MGYMTLTTHIRGSRSSEG